MHEIEGVVSTFQSLLCAAKRVEIDLAPFDRIIFRVLNFTPTQGDDVVFIRVFLDEPTADKSRGTRYGKGGFLFVCLVISDGDSVL